MKSRSYMAAAFTLLFASADGQGLYIPQSITVTAHAGNVRLKTNWINNGVFLHKAGRVTFAADTQFLSGTEPITFNDLSVENDAKVAMNTPGQKVKGIVRSNGILYANGLLLISTAEQTALVDGTGTGEVLGNVTMQRYLPSSFGYRYISSPFKNAVVGEISDEVDLASSFPSFYRYDENKQSTGWASHTDPAFPLLPFHGYAANLGNSLSPVTVDITGVVGNGQLSLYLYNNNQPFTKGFNLIGNPYPSPIDWDAAEGWSRVNIDNAVYYFNAGTANRYKGTYSSYINGVSSDGIANGIIPAMQGFFVHVSNGIYPVTGIIDVNNKARINNLTAHYHKSTSGETQLIRIKAGFVEYEHVSDPLVIYFDNKATNTFEQELDALKMMNTDEQVPNLYALAANERLSISAISSPSDSLTVIPLGVTTEMDGMLDFDTVQLNGLPVGMHIYFIDAKAGAVQDFSRQPKYRIALQKGVHDNRFCLAFSMKDPARHPFFNDAFDGWGYNGKLHLVLNMLSGGSGEVIVRSVNGQTVMRSTVNGFGHHEFDAPWATGIYVVSLVTKEKAYSKKIPIVN